MAPLPAVTLSRLPLGALTRALVMCTGHVPGPVSSEMKSQQYRSPSEIAFPRVVEGTKRRIVKFEPRGKLGFRLISSAPLATQLSSVSVAQLPSHVRSLCIPATLCPWVQSDTHILALCPGAETVALLSSICTAAPGVAKARSRVQGTYLAKLLPRRPRRSVTLGMVSTLHLCIKIQVACGVFLSLELELLELVGI